MSKKIDIFDLLTQSAVDRIDDIGYALLKEHGYDTDGAKNSKEKRNALKAALKKDGKQLIYFSMIDKETHNILFWFELRKNDEIIARSQAIKFLPDKTDEGGTDGEGESQERSSKTPEDNA